MTKFGVVTDMGRGVFSGVSHAHRSKGMMHSAPNFGDSAYTL